MNRMNIESRNLDNKPNQLRKMGFIPGTIYGATIKSTPIIMSLKQLRIAIEKPGEIYQVTHGDMPLFVKFGEVQKDAFSQELLHFSLVHMPEGVQNDVQLPINFMGTPAGTKKGGTLVVIKDEITIYGKPGSMPEYIEANVSGLGIGDKLTVNDLNIPKRVTAKEDDSEVIAICKAAVKEEPISTEVMESNEPELSSNPIHAYPL